MSNVSKKLTIIAPSDEVKEKWENTTEYTEYKENKSFSTTLIKINILLLYCFTKKK